MTTEIDAEGLAAYDAGLLNDFGGGNVEWWQDYIRAELGRAHDFYAEQLAASRSTSEAEPVAWIPKIAFDVFQKCGADERLASKAWSYKATPSAIALYAKPLPSPASDDQVEAAARAGWERGRRSFCPASILDDVERTERDWAAAWPRILAAMGSPKP